MPKIKMKVVKILTEKNEKTGKTLYRVFAESGGKTYTFGAREVDYLNEGTRKSIHRAWLKRIREDRFPPTPEMSPKEKRKAILGSEIEEDE